MATNDKRVIKDIVESGLKSLWKCLWDDPEYYWPQEGKENGLPERNLSIHVSHLFLKHGWLVFAEASYPNRTNRRIDLLAFRKGTLVAGECKQLDLADRAHKFADDAKDLRDFRLTTSWGPVPKISARYGLLLAFTWNQRIRTWWIQRGHHRSLPEGITGRGWRALGQQLDKIDKAGNAIYGEQWLNRADGNGKPDFWALYGIFQLPL